MELTSIQVASPAEIFDNELYKICNCSIDIYIKEYEKCSFRFCDGQHCTSRPAKLHKQHTSAKGQFQPGLFEHEREWSSVYKRDWIREIRKMFSNSYEKIFVANGNTDLSTSLEGRLASEREICHRSYYNMWKNIESNKTCLSCLQAVPDHVLGCGHSYCPRCIQELGHPSLSSECAWDMRCWLCWENKGQVSYSIQLKPRCAGVRILSLDGGGIRGIVELSVLQALHDAVGLELLPMKDMFDLIVGTSTGMAYVL
jgi:Patatin-like phospholipase